MVPLCCRATDYCDRVVEAIDSAVGFGVRQHVGTESDFQASSFNKGSGLGDRCT